VTPKTTRRDSGTQEGRMGRIIVRKVKGMHSFCGSVRRIRKSDFGKEDDFWQHDQPILEIRKVEDRDL
jgi:hypothetical protein